MPKVKIAVLGSTGSIGVQTLNVVRRHSDLFSVVFLANARNKDALYRQAEEFGVRNTYCISDCNENVFERDGIFGDADIVVNGIAGLDGLQPSLAALSAGKILATANKESLVCFGAELKAAAIKHGGEIRPVDSEHSAMWQCLEKKENVKRLIITASGGAFRDLTVDEIRNAKAADALKHPNWTMGQKVTVDCATMVNKALEIIEAKQLFGIKDVKPVIHRESIIHSMVEFTDGTVKASLSAPSMEIPIQYALTYPERLNSGVPELDFSVLRTLSFSEPDYAKYPALKIGEEVAAQNDEFYNTVFCAADETLVKLYLAGTIGYFDISSIIEKSLSHIPYRKIETISDVKSLAAEVASYVNRVTEGAK